MLEQIFLKKQWHHKASPAASCLAVALVCLLLFQTSLLVLLPEDSVTPHASWEDLVLSPGVLPATPAASFSDSRLSVGFEGLFCPLCAALQSTHRLVCVDNPLLFSFTGRMTLHRHTRRLLL